MKRIIIGLALLLTCMMASAQDYMQQLMDVIELNNTTLKAYREQVGANKIGNRTGINMSNPEVEVGYGWNKQNRLANETTVSVTQSFDFPTAYRHKSQLAKEKDKQVDLLYEQQRREVLQEARLLCVELMYQLRLNSELEKRYTHAKQLADSYESLFSKGNINVLERNKTKLTALTFEKSLQLNQVELSTLESELKRMNGGEPLLIDDKQISYFNFLLPQNFEDWLSVANANNPFIGMAMQDVTMSRKQEQLTRSLNLPKLSAGYSGEYVSGSTLHGFVVGVSIPLWEGKNTVKHQKAQTNAMEMQLNDSKIQFRNKLKNSYDKATRMSYLLNEYRNALVITNNDELLTKAFDQGQLSLINYLQELTVYYDAIDGYLEAERDYQLAVAELLQYN